MLRVVSTRRLHRFSVYLLIIFSVGACSDLPRDPKETLRRIEAGGTMRVGLVENPPWVIQSQNGEPAGAEVELIKIFAQQLGAKPEWHWGGEQQQLEALERFELDLVAGGLNETTPWSTRVGLTSPYYKNRIFVGVPPSMSPPKEIKGMQIAVKNGESAAAFVEKKDAVPVRVKDFGQVPNMAIAAPEWELEKLGMTPTKNELHAENHIWATPPGENGWIKRIEEFLSSQRPQVKSLLQQQPEGARR